MSEENGIYKFLEFLQNIEQLIELFKSMLLSTEIIQTLGLNEEQIEAGNVIIQELQHEWEDTFIMAMEIGLEWLKQNKEKRSES